MQISLSTFWVLGKEVIHLTSLCGVQIKNCDKHNVIAMCQIFDRLVGFNADVLRTLLLFQKRRSPLSQKTDHVMKSAVTSQPNQ